MVFAYFSCTFQFCNVSFYTLKIKPSFDGLQPGYDYKFRSSKVGILKEGKEEKELLIFQS